MTVSAVIPTKNRPALLAETVRALLAQTIVPDEVVVVDQSATDEGRRAVTALVQAAPAATPRPRTPRPTAVITKPPGSDCAARASSSLSTSQATYALKSGTRKP